MMKPDERVLVALNTIDHALVRWLTDSLAQSHNETIDANSDRMAAKAAGRAEVLRDILHSISDASDALKRVRS